jgi:hypothetical protein
MKPPRKSPLTRGQAKPEPSLRTKISQAFLQALEADFRLYGAGVIEAMRESDPTRYAELMGKVIMTAEPPSQDSWEATKSMEDVARKLLREVGTPDDWMTDAVVQAAIEANDNFIARLEEIRDRAQN